MKAIALTLAAGALGLAFAGTASALPLAPVAQVASESNDLQLVRDGCGRGFRFSDRRDRCVLEIRNRHAACPQNASARREEFDGRTNANRKRNLEGPSALTASVAGWSGSEIRDSFLAVRLDPG